MDLLHLKLNLLLPRDFLVKHFIFFTKCASANKKMIPVIWVFGLGLSIIGII